MSSPSRNNLMSMLTRFTSFLQQKIQIIRFITIFVTSRK
nr:MAG TPA: hypothetical protein [Bacteriophage sp.]